MNTALEIINTLATDEVDTGTAGRPVAGELRKLALETAAAARSFNPTSGDSVTLETFATNVSNLATGYLATLEKFVVLCDELRIFPTIPERDRLAAIAFDALMGLVLNAGPEVVPATADEFAASLWTAFTAD